MRHTLFLSQLYVLSPALELLEHLSDLLKSTAWHNNSVAWESCHTLYEMWSGGVGQCSHTVHAFKLDQPWEPALLFHQDKREVGMAVHSPVFTGRQGQLLWESRNSSSSSPAHALAMDKIKNWHSAYCLTRRHVPLSGLWAHEGRYETTGQLSWLSNHWKNGFMNGRESKLHVLSWISPAKNKRSQTVDPWQQLSPGEEPGFLTGRAAESEETREKKNLTCLLAKVLLSKKYSFLLESQFLLMLIDTLALSAHILWSFP